MKIESQIDVVSFAVCGTLLDCERGLGDALTSAAGLDAAQARQLIADRVDVEWEMLDEFAEFVPYRVVFAASLEKAAAGAGLALEREAAQRIAASIPDWPLFPDVATALPRLAAGRRLALVSNVDEPDLVRIARRLGVPVARTVSAGDIGIYKPAPELLLALLHELRIDESQLLHVSASVERDLYTAEDLEVAAVYLSRSGAAPPEDLTVSGTVPDLDALAGALGPPRRRKPPARRAGGDRPVGARPRGQVASRTKRR